MKKRDWIILRLIMVALNQNPREGRRSRDVAESIVYLNNKYGWQYVARCLDRLRGEEAQRKQDEMYNNELQRRAI